MSVNCDLSDVVDNHAISTQKLHAGWKLRMGIKCADQLPYDGDRKGEWRTCECRVTSLIPCLQKISSTRRCVHELWMWMLNVNTNGQMLLNWDATCSKDMRSYPSFISFTFHYSAFISHDSFPILVSSSHVTIHLLTSLPPLHLLLSRHSIVAHPNRQVLLCIIRSLTLYSKRTSVSSTD